MQAVTQPSTSTQNKTQSQGGQQLPQLIQMGSQPLQFQTTTEGKIFTSPSNSGQPNLVIGSSATTSAFNSQQQQQQIQNGDRSNLLQQPQIQPQKQQQLNVSATPLSQQQNLIQVKQEIMQQQQSMQSQSLQQSQQAQQQPRASAPLQSIIKLG